MSRLRLVASVGLVCLCLTCNGDNQIITTGMNCIDVVSGDSAGSQPIAQQHVDYCTYARAAQTLEAKWVSDGNAADQSSVIIRISAFSGAGSYTTDDGGTTLVDVGGDIAGADSKTPSGAEAKRCTIVATTELGTVQIPSGETVETQIQLEVSCPAGLRSAATNLIECSLNPSTFVLDGLCTASE